MYDIYEYQDYLRSHHSKLPKSEQLALDKFSIRIGGPPKLKFIGSKLVRHTRYRLFGRLKTETETISSVIEELIDTSMLCELCGELLLNNHEFCEHMVLYHPEWEVPGQQ